MVQQYGSIDDEVHQPEDPSPPQPPAAYTFFTFIQGVAVVLSAITLLLHGWALTEKSSIMDVLLRIYLCLTTWALILAECSVTAVLKCLHLDSLESNWVYRGYMYSFVGVVSYHSPLTLLNSWVNEYVSYGLFGWGLLYVFMGCCCLHGVWQRMRQSYQDELERLTDRRELRVN